MFNHKLLERIDIPSVFTEEGKFYQTELGLLPSVTSVLKKHLPSKELDAWKKRVGENEASQISFQASFRGNAIHECLQKYLMNDSEFSKDVGPINLFYINQIKPILQKNIQEIYGVELPLFSKLLRVAGTTDCFTSWNSRPTIIDFKTSKRLKKEEYILGYFLQATIYALMVEEIYDIFVPKILIIVFVDGDSPQLFLKDKYLYFDKLKEIFSNVKSETAIAIAVDAHQGQKRWNGEPYILHPMRVMLTSYLLHSEKEQIVAILHDVVEDCPRWTFDKLRVEGFSSEIIEAIDSVTKREGESYDDFIQRASKNKIGAKVKLADLYDNSRDRTSKKYEDAKKFLQKAMISP